MKVKIVELNFTAPFTCIPESFTIFGGLCWMYYLLYGENDLKEDIIKKFFSHKPPFLLSSLFPVNGDSYYLPKPIYKFEISENFNYSDLKKIKKIEYIDLQSFIHIKDCIKDGNLEEIPKALLNSKVKSFIKKSQPHVNLDKISYTSKGTGNLFFEDYVFIKKGYFIMKFLEDKIEEKILNSLKLLSINGLGGNKTTGMGKFSYNVKNINDTKLNNLFSSGQSFNCFLTLSPIIIDSFDKIDIDSTYYEIYFFRGVIDNFLFPSDENIWKKKFCYLKAGSVVKKDKNETFIGKCPIALNFNNKEIIQYGLEFPIYL